MRQDPTIERVRQTRREISQEFGHDPRKLVEHYKKYQKRFSERLVTRPGARAMAPSSETC